MAWHNIRKYITGAGVICDMLEFFVVLDLEGDLAKPSVCILGM
jgi:hypothetical protein